MPTTEPTTGPTSGPAGLAALYPGCRDAEDWFRALDVAYDPRVLDVSRLHVLRLFGRELERLAHGGGPPPAGDALRAVHRDALERAYQALVTGGPLTHRVFTVLADHAPGRFVPVAEVRTDPRPDARPDPHADVREESGDE